MHVDPIVGKQILSADDQPDGDEIAVVQSPSRMTHRIRRRRIHHSEEIPYSQTADEMLAHVAPVPGFYCRDAPFFPSDALHRSVHNHLRSALLQHFLHFGPHHSGAAPRIMELSNQGLDRFFRFAAQFKRVPDQRRKGKSANALRCPIGADGRARNSPHLLGVAFEKHLEQAGAEAVGNPCRQIVFRLLRKQAGLQETDPASGYFNRSQAAQDIHRIQRIAEKLAAVVDPRQPRAFQEVRPQHFLPDARDQANLGVKPVASQVEQIALVVDGLRQAAHHGIAFHHDATKALA
jgi:hypothetical protein